jgi:glycosyltransferase involved in cell wall biosynthesis
MPNVEMPHRYAESPGVIALAAYKPDATLFARQLRSIQSQSYDNFVCVISVDGQFAEASRMVRDAIGGDERFHVLGYNDRLGFYRNFERALFNITPEASWIALSDQDDYWYPTKLERLLPHLDNYTVVAGQSRVVEEPSGRVIKENTDRRNSPLTSFMVENQYTGGAMVFRRAVLSLALPFPGLSTPSEVHDHWLAVCGATLGPTLILDTVVQDYVQHGLNVIGEVRPGFRPLDSIRNTVRIARKFEGSASPLAILRAIYNVGVGWRTVMADSILERIASDSLNSRPNVAKFSSNARCMPAFINVLQGWRAGDISIRSAAEYLAGFPAGCLLRVTASLTSKIRRGRR